MYLAGSSQGGGGATLKPGPISTRGAMGATFFDRPPATAPRYVFRPPFTRAAPVLPGAPDPRCEVPDDAARCAGPRLWGTLARGVEVVVRGDPPAGGVARRGVPE